MLRDKSAWVRRELLMLNQRAPETRVASSLSAVEIFTALYYGGVLNQYPHDPYHPERDRCIISKGHGSICMYPILADLGFFAKSELEKICQSGSFLGGIPDPVIPGYESVNGSLGHGLGVASGIAKALIIRAKKESVFVVCGDGELHEGSNWEAIMFAAQHNLDNLNLIVDNNSIAMLGFTNDILTHDGFKRRFEAFGWEYFVQADGHDAELISESLNEIKNRQNGKPKILVVDTVKGRGLPSLENHPLSHVLAANPLEVKEILGAQDDE